MPGNPNRATVNVHILLGQTPNFSFSSSHLQVGPNNELTFANNGKPGFLIEYHLVNPPSNYRFPVNSIPNNLQEALYSAVGTDPCPNVPGQWCDFTAQTVKDQGLTLVVRNRNDSVAQFGYVLRVTNDDGANYLPLDPGGFNQNGPQFMEQISPLVAGAIGAVAGSLLTLGAHALMNH